MSFFGFEENDLEKEKQRFLQGATQNTEHLAEFTWGEESYDGLGDALQEGGDELNDETFGSGGAVGARRLAPTSISLLILEQARTLISRARLAK